MGPVFYFSRKGVGWNFVIRNRKRATGLLCSDKNKSPIEKNFFPEIHPHMQVPLYFYLNKIQWVCQLFSQPSPSPQDPSPIVRRAVDEGAGRCFHIVQVAQKLLANFVQHYHLTSSRIYAIIIIEVEGNNEKNKKILKNP